MRKYDSDVAGPNYVLVNIRKFTGLPIRDLDELIDRDTLDVPVAAFVRACLKTAREHMDLIAAYREVGTYRGAAALCGTTHKTARESSRATSKERRCRPSG